MEITAMSSTNIFMSLKHKLWCMFTQKIPAHFYNYVLVWGYVCLLSFTGAWDPSLQSFSSSRMCVMNHNWSATKQYLHPQSVAEISSFVRGQDSTMWDIVWVSPQGHRSMSVIRHFLLQAPQCPCSMRIRFSRDHCCRGRVIEISAIRKLGYSFLLAFYI